MKADFQDAHIRHWTDAEYLFQAQRWANADHLYGVAAECGLKALIETGQGAPLSSPDFVHVMEHRKASNAWERYVSYHAGKLGPKFTLPDENPFTDWDISDRYASREYFNIERVQAHQRGARLVHQLHKQAFKLNSNGTDHDHL